MKQRTAEHFRKYNVCTYSSLCCVGLLVVDRWLAAQIPFFSAIPFEKYALLARLSKIEQVPAGHVIFREGDAGTAFYIMIHGQARVSVHASRRIRKRFVADKRATGGAGHLNVTLHARKTSTSGPTTGTPRGSILQPESKDSREGRGSRGSQGGSGQQGQQQEERRPSAGGDGKQPGDGAAAGSNSARPPPAAASTTASVELSRVGSAQGPAATSSAVVEPSKIEIVVAEVGPLQPVPRTERGSVSVSVSEDPEDELEIALLGPGNYFGEVSLFAVCCMADC